MSLSFNSSHCFEKPVNWMFGWGDDLYVMS